MWFCQSCQSTFDSTDRVAHFTANHWFKPSSVQAPVPEMKQQDTTYKLTESEENGSIWHESYDIEMVCPKCRIESKATFKVTQKSVRIDCMNEECKYIMFYRQVALGYVEAPKVE